VYQESEERASDSGEVASVLPREARVFAAGPSQDCARKSHLKTERYLEVKPLKGPEKEGQEESLRGVEEQVFEKKKKCRAEKKR